ncbi:MAG: CPBP family intramembrane metalloprotease [Bacteroidetes bacterium]|jgi:membrane protease YdiL (CAAX protease family)|nr:CPBP family intramembrane metalloprotease [Bacteroidota bacterium]
MRTPFRSHKLKFSWHLGLSLILLFGISRFFIVLEANRSGSYGLTSVIFMIMILTPFLLLTREGRQSIGLTFPKNVQWLTVSFLLGVLLCALIFWIGDLLYQDTLSNWFVYISESYSSVPEDQLTGSNLLTYFLMFALVGMTFSPFGEEFLYRGLIHRCFTDRFGDNRASMIDSAAFATVHLAHFGIVFSAGEWTFLAIPALLWMGLMYVAGRMFYVCRQKTISIFGAVIAHAGFNLAMTWFIFYCIL